jgi:hypothetical protein
MRVQPVCSSHLYLCADTTGRLPDLCAREIEALSWLRKCNHIHSFFW